jgi:DNA polymerase elongation subunit (family B)
VLSKGTANVRRDVCELARECIGDTLTAVVTMPDDHKAHLAPIIKACAELANPDVSLERLARTVAVRAAYSSDNLLQVRLFKKIEQRRGQPLDVGSRVPFVITLPNGGRRLRRKDDKLANDGEDITYMRDNGVRADRGYYLEKQILNPLMRYVSVLIPPKEINRIVQKASDAIYVQTSRNRTLDAFLASSSSKPNPQAALPLDRLVLTREPDTASTPNLGPK